MARTAIITDSLDLAVREYIDSQLEHSAAGSTCDYVNAFLGERYEKDMQDLLDTLEEGINDANAGRVVSAEVAFDLIRGELGLEVNHSNSWSPSSSSP